MPQSDPTPAAAPKVGLALSGGGHRAALFHLGVLARLAETGLLRRVEVISTVSGGSILGALYYLHLKRLLETKPDAEITDADYVEVVATVEAEFMAGIRKNVRARIFTNLWSNFLMSKSSYSRSDRIGDLLDRLLYRPAWPVPRTDPIRMDELVITPSGDPHTPFRPDTHNGSRSAKVPVIMINATSLNTGHNWRFEAIRMGEPAPDDAATQAVASEVDKNERFAQGYFDAERKPDDQALITGQQRDFPLGTAVAASACVPMLFHPLSISKLYPEGVQVQLVDGGVHDNQGVQALFDSDCDIFLISDASGQMPDQALPATRIPGVAGRAISIYGDRVRDEQLMHAYARDKPLVLCHLRKGLASTVVAPLDDSGQPTFAAQTETGPVLAEDFGVTQDVQFHLARVRTDLDSFADSESYSLMLDGYLMADHEIEGAGVLQPMVAPGVPRDPSNWAFGAVAGYIGATDPPAWYPRSLAAAKERFMKPTRLVPGGHMAFRLILYGVVAALILWAIIQRDDVRDALSHEWPIWWIVVPALAVLFLAFLYLKERSHRPLRWFSTFFISFLVPILFAPFLWVVSWVTLALNPLFLWLGRVRD